MMCGLDEAPADQLKHQRSSGTTLPWFNAVMANGRRQVLNNISGHIESGEITALLGPSGAGKTSLLNALTVHRSGLSGQVKVVDLATNPTETGGRKLPPEVRHASRCRSYRRGIT